MSSDVRFLRSQISIFYHQLDVRSLDQHLIARVARGRYLPPILMENPGSESLLVLVSENGNSQIVFTSSSVALNVTYSRQWQHDPILGEQYVTERLPLLLKLLDGLDDHTLIYTGCSVDCQISTDQDDSAIIEAIGMLSGNVPHGRITDLAFKFSEIVDDKYYRNTTVTNFRTFVAGPQTPPQIRLKNSTASERGIEASVEFNSRYAYNEGNNLSVTADESMGIVRSAFAGASSITGRVAEKVSK